MRLFQFRINWLLGADKCHSGLNTHFFVIDSRLFRSLDHGVKYRKVLLTAALTLVFWIILQEASAQLPGRVAPISDFAAISVPVDCALPDPALPQLKENYRAGILNLKQYFQHTHKVSKEWSESLSQFHNKTVKFPKGHFASIEASAQAMAYSSSRMTAWVDEFTRAFDIFSNSYSKCSSNKSRREDLAAAFGRFTEMSTEAHFVTIALMDHTAQRMQAFAAEWSELEEKSLTMSEDQFEALAVFAAEMAEAAELIADNAELALAEL